MHFVDRPFRCYSDLPLDLCKQRILAEFANRESFHTSILTSEFSESQGIFTVHFEFYPVGVPVIVNAKLTPNDSHADLSGDAKFPASVGWGILASVLLGLPIIPALFFSPFALILLILWYGSIFSVVYYLQRTRDRFIQTLCNALR